MNVKRNETFAFAPSVNADFIFGLINGKKMRKVISRKKLSMEKGFLVPGPNEKDFIQEAKDKKFMIASRPSRRVKSNAIATVINGKF